MSIRSNLFAIDKNSKLKIQAKRYVHTVTKNYLNISKVAPDVFALIPVGNNTGMSRKESIRQNIPALAVVKLSRQERDVNTALTPAISRNDSVISMMHEVWKKEADYQLAKVFVQHLGKEALLTKTEMQKCLLLLKKEIAPPVSELQSSENLDI